MADWPRCDLIHACSHDDGRRCLCRFLPNDVSNDALLRSFSNELLLCWLLYALYHDELGFQRVFDRSRHSKLINWSDLHREHNLTHFLVYSHNH